MSIIGIIAWFSIGIGMLYCSKKGWGLPAVLGMMPAAFLLQYLGINMGCWLMWKGVMLIASGGI